MPSKAKIAAIVLPIALVAYLVAPSLFPPPPGPPPTTAQVPLLLLLRALDSLLLGIGVAFVVFGWPLVRRITPDSRRRAVVMFAAVAWVTISWYPHIGLHGSAFGATLSGVLVIDYIFHIPLYLVGLALVWGVFGYLRNASKRPTTESVAADSVAAHRVDLSGHTPQASKSHR
jgi:hypothetical protein